jgi:hypothetical protein
MRCSLCDRVMLSRSSQTIEEDGEVLVLTVWGCSACHRVEEEIWVSRGYHGMRPRRLRYAVTPVPSPGLRHSGRVRIHQGISRSRPRTAMSWRSLSVSRRKATQ